MPHLKLSRKAQLDLPRLYTFLAKYDEGRAQVAVEAILAAFKTLTMPGIGAPVPGRTGLRKLVIPYGESGYAALYRYSKVTDTIVVLAIKHQREENYV
jgi:plasmid stabilization system protein ParE